MKKYLLAVAGICVGFLSAQEIKEWTLQEMVDYAAENNLTLENARINNKLVENNILAAKRQRLPSVNANFDNNLIVGVTGVPITNSNQQITGTTNGYQLFQNSWGVGAQMTLYNRGKYRLNEEKANIDLSVANQDLLATLNDISLNIVNQYLNVLLNRELVATAQEQVKISEEQLRRNRILYDGGAIPLSQVYESESVVAQDKQQLATSKINVDEAKFNLAQLLQLPDYREFDVVLVDVPEELTPALLDMEEITAYAFEHQPKIKGAELNVESAKLDIDLAKTDYWPTINANYNVGTNYRTYLNGGIESDGLFEQWWDNHSHSIGLGVNIPIFNKNLTDLNVENAEIRVQAAESNIKLRKQSLKSEIQSAYFMVNSSYEQFKASQEAVRSAELSFEFAEKSFNAGKITIYDFNKASTTLFTAKSNMLQSKYNYIFRLKVLDFYAGKPLTFENGINP